MNRLIKRAKELTESGYKDIYTKHIKLTSAEDDYVFFFDAQAPKKLRQEFGDKRFNEYAKIIKGIKLDDRPAIKELSCSDCKCLHCNNEDCFISLCEGAVCEPEYYQESIKNCHMSECKGYKED